MAESDFIQYLENSLKSMLYTKAEELVRVTFSEETYSSSKSDLRPQCEIDSIMKNLQGPINVLVEKYIFELKEKQLDSAKSIVENRELIQDIAKKIDDELETLLIKRLEK